MRTISNWNNITPAQSGGRAKLPADAYICRIKAAVVEKYTANGNTFEKLALSFDIEEGEWAGYYADLWRSNTAQDKKWKGVFRQTIPADDGSQQDEKTKSYFKGAIKAIEDSNPGYTFNFDEKTLVGKLVGILYRDEEYDFNGYHGMSAKPLLLMDIHRVNEGDYQIPKAKMLNANAEILPPPAFGAAPAYSAAPPAAPMGYNPYTTPTAQPVQVPSFAEIGAGDDLPF